MDDQNDNPSDTASAMAQLKSLRAIAEKGDLSALPRLRAFLDEHPEIWQQIGDLGQHVRESLLELAGGNDLAAAESIRRKMGDLNAELIGESTSPTVRLLAEQCVICWVQVNLAELAMISKELNGGQRGYDVQRRFDAIQGRYLRALKTLVTVRRLLEPVYVPATPRLKVIG